jgi:hypothetical protein
MRSMAAWYQNCVGGCGNLLKMGTLRFEPPVCLDCRRRRRLILCEWCNMPFRPRDGSLKAKYCCRRHAALGIGFGKRFRNVSESERSGGNVTI